MKISKAKKKRAEKAELGFIGLRMAEAEKLGVTMLIGNMARQLWSYGVHHGGAKKDSSTLITYLEAWAGAKVKGKGARSHLK